MQKWILFPTDLLFAVLILVLGMSQRRVRGWGFIALGGEFLLLATARHILGISLGLALLSFYAVLFALDYCFHADLGWSLDDKVLRFAFREIQQSKVLLSARFGQNHYLILVILLTTAVLSATAPAASRTMTLVALFFIAGTTLLVAVVKGNHLPPVPNVLSAMLGLILRPSMLPCLGKTNRIQLPSESLSDGPRPNVLILVCESINKRLLYSPEGQEAAPRYHDFIEKQSSRIFPFAQALCNSSASDVAYPSLFTGLSPDESYVRFHRNPLIWALAKANWYNTSLYSSQSLRWCNLDEFLIDGTLDRAVYREVLKAPAFNELAMDDLILNKFAITELSQEKRPFFSVVNYNMLHFPYLNGEEHSAHQRKSPGALYLKALGRFDQCFGDLLDALAASGKLAKTAIFFTGDHGEAPEQSVEGSGRVMPLRVNDFNMDILLLPFWIRLPEETLSKQSELQLRTNTETLVSNVDIYPTLMHLLGYDAKKRGELSSGHSLFDPIPSTRHTIVFNSGALREWKFEPFAIGSEGHLLIYHDVTRKLELICMDDPLKRNIWDLISASERAAWTLAVESHSALHDLLSKRELLPLVTSQDFVKQEYNDRALLGSDVELHQLNNWVLFSASDWVEMCLHTARFTGIENGDSVFEAGCGAGAFLEVLRTSMDVRVAGVDLAENLIEIARRRVPGEFWVGDIQDMSFLPSDSYDRVVSHGVFLYLPSHQAVKRAALEMIRMTKPGGTIYIGLLNDPARIKTYRSNHSPSGNTITGRDFWKDLAKNHSLELQIADQDAIYSKSSGYDGHSRLRYSVCMRKSAIN